MPANAGPPTVEVSQAEFWLFGEFGGPPLDQTTQDRAQADSSFPCRWPMGWGDWKRLPSSQCYPFARSLSANKWPSGPWALATSKLQASGGQDQI